MNVQERAFEVFSSGLPLHHGAQLAVDITLRSALTAQGRARPNASHVNERRSPHTRSGRERGEIP